MTKKEVINRFHHLQDEAMEGTITDNTLIVHVSTFSKDYSFTTSRNVDVSISLFDDKGHHTSMMATVYDDHAEMDTKEMDFDTMMDKFQSFINYQF